MQSHPTRVRGLKHAVIVSIPYIYKSHPTRVRGLKLRLTWANCKTISSHPTRVRGLKLSSTIRRPIKMGVAPHAGAWIETLKKIGERRRRCLSHPTRVRGLKLRI